MTFEGRVLNRAPAHKRTHLGLARSFQLPRPFRSMSVADNIRVPLLYTVRRRTGLIHSAKDLDHRCLELLSLVGVDTWPSATRATSPRSRCASSSWPARWPPSPSC